MYTEESIEVFERTRQTYDEPVAETVEEAEEFWKTAWLLK